MNVKGINTHMVNSVYKNNKVNAVNKTKEINSKDSIEISQLAKSLRGYATGEKLVDNSKKIEELRNQINNGTYTVDAKLTAEKMVDYMKGRRV
ncbi:MAG: flagellar biosynthesis anti-sigma factor FlgM [Clostridium sp.]